MKTYTGASHSTGCDVLVNEGMPFESLAVAAQGKSLNPRVDLHNHGSPCFGWGSSNAGSAQLALAILADALQDDQRALRLHLVYAEARIAKMTMALWTMREDAVLRDAAILEKRLAGNAAS